MIVKLASGFEKEANKVSEAAKKAFQYVRVNSKLAGRAIGKGAAKAGEKEKELSGILNKKLGVKEGPEKSKIVSFLKNHSAGATGAAIVGAGGGALAARKTK